MKTCGTGQNRDLSKMSCTAAFDPSESEEQADEALETVACALVPWNAKELTPDAREPVAAAAAGASRCLSVAVQVD